jgi:glyoxylase-like metal-dependent hydrolase (beta-lactamase superfamily II)
MTTDLTLSRRAALTGLGATAALAATGIAPTQAAAPMLGASAPTVRRVMLGGFEVTTIHDGAIQLDGPHPIFGQNVTAEEVQALASDNLLPPTRMEIGFSPTIVNTGSELVLFDAGNGAGRRPNAGHLRARLADAGYTPEQVDIVVLTHFHPDHIGGLMEDGAPAYPNARYVAAAAEYDFWSPEERASGPTERVGKLTQSNVLPLAEKMSFLKDGDTVVSGVTGVDSSGHTPGHMAYHLESDGKRLVITGDIANHYVVSLQRPDWHVRFDMDKEGAAAARKKIFGMLAADKVPFIGYHMPPPAMGFVTAEGVGFRYHPASYQLNM